MDSSNIVAQLKEFWAKVPQKQLVFVLLLLLTLSIAYSMAQLTWLLMPKAKQNNNITIVQMGNSAATSLTVDVKKLSVLNLFGKAEAKKAAPKQSDVVKVFDAPETKLNLTLTSAVASSDDERSAAIIENNKLQQTYAIGDKITGTNAVLNNILIDRVIIDVNGRKETLMLDGFEYTQVSEQQIVGQTKKPAKVPAVASTNVVTKNPEFSKRIKELKDVISTDPAKITDYINISPVREGTSIKGYRLLPASDASFFNQSGLKAGDLATEINGRDLTDPRQAMEALQLLRTESEITLTVERAGQVTEVFFSTL